MTIVFENKGAIDIRAIKTFGISAKDNDSAIGFFGTGLKYAIAILLREKQEIVIQSGLKKYEFTTKTFDSRGKQFEIVCMNGKELGFTTELGKTWELWQAFRELYCNCTDEGGKIRRSKAFKAGHLSLAAKDSELVESDDAKSDSTIICVTGEKFDAIYSKRGEVILLSKPINENSDFEIHEGLSQSVYFKNIRISNPLKPTLFTYNIKKNLDLTEDRTAKYDFQVRAAICGAILQSDDDKFIEACLTATEGYYEHDLDYQESYRYTDPGMTFLRVVGELREKKDHSVNKTACRIWTSRQTTSSSTEVISLSEPQKTLLDSAIELCDEAGFNVDKYQIIIVNSLGSKFSQVEMKNIFLSVKLFDKGRGAIAKNLIHRYLEILLDAKHKDGDIIEALLESIIKARGVEDDMVITNNAEFRDTGF